MNEVFKIVLSLSFSGTLLIFILCLLRPLFKERLSKWWQYYIWLVVIARLLLPFTPAMSLTGALFQEIDVRLEQSELSQTQAKQDGMPAHLYPNRSLSHGQDVPSVEMQRPKAADQPARNIPAIMLEHIWLIWLMAASVLFVRKITVYQSFVNYIRAGCEEVTDFNRLEQVGALAAQNKIKTAVELHTNSLISSPLLIGFFRPCIVLPSADLPESDFQYTILHELTHYKRRDMFYKWLLQLTICVHWFNPLVRLMGREVSRLCELSCDESVIKTLDPKLRRSYGDTLLHAMGTGGNYKNSVASVTLNESKELLQERLDAIINYKRKSKLCIAVTSVFTVILFFCSLITGAYAADFKTGSANEFQSISSEFVLLNDSQDITAINLQAAVGNLIVLYGDKPSIEIGSKLVNHASFSYHNGILVYRDDFGKHNLSFPEISSKEYDIIITIPPNSELETLSADVEIGSIVLQNIKAASADLMGTANINIDGFHGETLDVNSTLSDISASDISILNELRLYSYGSTALVSGDIKGSVLIDSSGISNTKITFVNSDRSDYTVKSTWAPESQNKEPGNFLLENGSAGIIIDGKKYGIEYSDSNPEAPYQVTVISRELMPMENIKIRFTD